MRLIQNWEDSGDVTLEDSVHSFDLEVEVESETDDLAAPAILRPNWSDSLRRELLETSPVPRPKLGWEGRRVKFGKKTFYLEE